MPESSLVESTFQLLSGPGFLGTRGPLFSDIVVAALGLVVPMLLYGVKLARQGRHAAHGVTMASTWIVLSVVVAAFVVWNDMGGPPAAPRLEASGLYSLVYLPLLVVHICVAFASLVIAPLVGALGFVRRSPRARAGWMHSLVRRHAGLGRLTLGMLIFTSVSGISIYCFRYVY